MADTINVEVKNTVINIIGEDEIAEKEALRSRINAEPVPHLHIEQRGRMESKDFDHEKPLNVSPRTSLGDCTSEVTPCCSEDSSSVASPFNTASVLNGVQATSCASSMGLGLEVKNTFINVVGDDELAQREALRSRTHTEPAPQLHLEQSGNEENPHFECDKALNVCPTTSLGDHASDVVPCCRDGSSSIDSPFNTASVVSRVQASPCASTVCLKLEVPPQQDVPHEPANQMHAKSCSADIPAEWQGKTSVMVRNVSYKCTRDMFRDELHKAGFANLFDYLYVPINMKRNTSKGYAFLNFVDAASAYRFKERFDGRKMEVPGGVKSLEVIPSKVMPKTFLTSSISETSYLQHPSLLIRRRRGSTRTGADMIKAAF